MTRVSGGVSWAACRVLGDSCVFVDPNALSVGANIGLVEDASGEQLELLFLQGDKQAAADLGGGDNFVERDAAHLTLPTQMFAK